MISIQKHNPDERFPPPSRGREGDAAYDLRSAMPGEIHIAPGTATVVPTGWCWQLPPGWCGLVLSRSGWSVNASLDVVTGLLDSNYRGELHVILHNRGSETVMIKYGYRIGQLLVVPHWTGEPVEVKELPATVRGEGKFGSSGGMDDQRSGPRVGGVAAS